MPFSQVFWLLTFNSPKTSESQDRSSNPTLMDALDMYSVGMPPIQWLSWIPQLLTCLAMDSGAPVKDLLTQVSVNNELRIICKMHSKKKRSMCLCMYDEITKICNNICIINWKKNQTFYTRPFYCWFLFLNDVHNKGLI